MSQCDRSFGSQGQTYIVWRIGVRTRLRSWTQGDSLIFVALTCVLLLALGVRLLGIEYGLPHTYHTDEPTLVDRALRILRTGDYNPHFFNYPSLGIYFQSVVYAFYFVAGATEETATILRIGDMPNHMFYMPGRVATALIGTATIGILFSIARRLYPRDGVQVGLVAALLLAVMPAHVSESRWITPNVPMAFLAMLSLLFACEVWRRGKWSDYFLAGLFAGLAASVKYNGILIIVSLFAAHAVRREKNWALLAVAILLVPVGFVVGTPYAVLDPDTFLHGFRAEQIHYRFRGHAGQTSALS